MIRTTVISVLAIAGALASAPAFAEGSVNVAVAGKSPAEAYAAIVTAAQAVCRGLEPGDPHGLFSTGACVRGAIDDAIAQAKSPALTHYAAGASSYLHLASN